MPLSPLPLFPQGSLADSVVITVWVGVWVICLLNLRFGWVLSGLVVPGYLVPLMLVKPWSAGVIVLEAVITYGLTWAYSERLAPQMGWSTLFGRDWFFALLVVSVLVRALLDSTVLPALAEFANQALEIDFDYRNNLHSFGLIVVALIANQFRKTGLTRGVIPFATSTALTFLIVRHLLMPLTNFSVGNITYMYENIAISMLASPKAHIILLTTAFTASRMNLRYGWEYNGILIPALIALQWYQPMKVVITFAEALLILGMASALLRLPVFRKVTMEGARKDLFFFNISFIYKMALGHLAPFVLPRVPLSDLFGFGYLLTTLMAIRMHDKEIAVRMTRATLQTSLVALIIASGIGYALTLIPNPFAAALRPVAAASEPSRPPLSLIDTLQADKVALYGSMRRNAFLVPLPAELEVFSEALKELHRHLRAGEPEPLESARALLARVGYRLHRIEGRYLYLDEPSPQRGWGIYVLDTQTKNPLLVEIPAPLDEWRVMEAGARLFRALDAQALAVAGSGRRTNVDGSSDPLQSPTTFFHQFHKVFGPGHTLQVRGQTPAYLRRLPGEGATPSPVSALWIRGDLPDGLELPRLSPLLGDYRIHWGDTPFANILREPMRHGFAELVLNRTGIRNLLFKPLFVRDVLTIREKQQSISGYLQEWLLAGKSRIAPRGSNAYRPPTLEQLLFADQEVLTPLLRIAETAYVDGAWRGSGVDELVAVVSSAAVLGLQIIRYHHLGSGDDYLIIAEPDEGPEKRYWGTVVLRLGNAEEAMVQIPHPLSEINTLEYGAALFERLNARVLLIGGAHPQANTDGSAELLHPANKGSFFSLMNQVAVREAGERPMLTLQCRAFGFKESGGPASYDALLALKSGIFEASSFSGSLKKVNDLLAEDDLRVGFVNGSIDTAGYEVGRIPQALYLDESLAKEFAVLWLSPLLRSEYRQQTHNLAQINQFKALEIPTVEEDLFGYLARTGATSPPGKGADPAALTEIKRAVTHYMTTQDIIALGAARRQRAGLGLVRLVDINSKQAFLVIHGPSGRPLLCANLVPRASDGSRTLPYPQLTRRAIRGFVESRDAWLSLEER